MKKVIIIRHAKSSWTDFNLSDFERPLDERGVHDGPIMANRLKEAGHFPQKIISSSAVRAKTTAGYFSDVFHIPVEETKALYHAYPDVYLDFIRSMDENTICVALVGHNPGITYLANDIAPGSTDNIPTCGIIVADLGDHKWAEADWHKMKLLRFMFPKDRNDD